ncbi:MAG: folate-binding protein YgfZ [Ardenticatenaceae bacterium]|nr:folate-binding protein YgfZ [Ardenticatenaceae bacterium]
MMMKSQISLEQYEAAHETAVFVDRSNLGMLKFTGATRLDLINRMSTQAVSKLQSGEGAATILTTDIGRIIDRLILYASSEAVYCLTSENNADNIARYLLRFVFFTDDFRLENLSGETAVYAVYGPQAQTKLVEAGFPEVDLPLYHWQQVAVAGLTAYLHRTDGVAGDGFFVMCQTADKEALQAHLLSVGLVEVEEAAFDFLRIESGLPRFGRELTLDYIPLEANLWPDVSFNKGCYTGQEIIARMESRGRLAKKLLPLQPAAPVEVGAVLQVAGKTAGTVTSTAVGPNGPVALGYVRTGMEEEALTVGETAVVVRH